MLGLPDNALGVVTPTVSRRQAFYTFTQSVLASQYSGLPEAYKIPKDITRPVLISKAGCKGIVAKIGYSIQELVK